MAHFNINTRAYGGAYSVLFSVYHRWPSDPLLKRN